MNCNFLVCDCVQLLLSHVGSWDFDVFHLDTLTGGNLIMPNLFLIVNQSGLLCVQLSKYIEIYINWCHTGLPNIDPLSTPIAGSVTCR